ncbi:MAG: peptidylprolyl isomerase [Prochlorococcaceae cyanobacterium]
MLVCGTSKAELPALMDASPLIEMPSGRPYWSVEELNRLMRQQGLGLAVAQASVYDEVARAVALPPQEEQAEVAAYLERQEIAGEEALPAFLERQGWSEDDLTYFATKGRRLGVFQERCFGEDVENRFLERKIDLDQVVYSMVRVEEREVSEEIYQRLVEGENDFPELAEAFSIGTERNTRGLIGPVPLSAAHPELFSRLRVSRQGQLWPPFHVVDIWVVLRFERLIPAQLNNTMRATLLEELFEEWFDARVRLLMQGEPLPPLPLPSRE